MSLDCKPPSKHCRCSENSTRKLSDISSRKSNCSCCRASSSKKLQVKTQVEQPRIMQGKCQRITTTAIRFPHPSTPIILSTTIVYPLR